MFVRELFYKDLDSLKSILKFIYNHNTQCKNVTISAPINDKIKFVLDNPKNTEIKIKPLLMGRVINVEEYINGLEVDEDIDINANIFIEDTFIKENNGVFNIRIKDKKVEAKKVDDDYSLYLNINNLTQLAFSFVYIKDIMILNNINQDESNKDAIHLLKILFNKKENYINEYV